MSKSIYIETYGCSANQNNSELMAGILIRNGFNLVENEKISDLIIINTCIVKSPTINKIEERIKEIVKQKKPLVVAGCMPEVFLKKLKRIAPNSSFLSVNRIKEISKVVNNLFEHKTLSLIGRTQEEKICISKSRKKKIIGITQIASGCLGKCSYCIVNKVKGSLFSYQEEKILRNIEEDLISGAKEIWLTSQDNSCYGLDQETSLPELINKICLLKHKFFLRIGMMNPEHASLIIHELINSYKSEKVFKFLHLPIQSGSNKILKLMNRKYNTKQVLYIIDAFKKKFPEIIISTDIIVGFPGETNDDFNKTLTLIKKIKPDILNHSRFWPMLNTSASKMPNQISRGIIKKREIELMKLHARIALENKELLVGKIYKVIIDEKGFQDTWLARNENYQLIVIRSKEDLLGKFLKVKIKEAKPHYLIGETIE